MEGTVSEKTDQGPGSKRKAGGAKSQARAKPGQQPEISAPQEPNPDSPAAEPTDEGSARSFRPAPPADYTELARRVRQAAEAKDVEALKGLTALLKDVVKQTWASGTREVLPVTEPGVIKKTRLSYPSGVGSNISTLYAASPRRPAGYPEDLPFIPDMLLSVGQDERPGRPPSLQLYQISDVDAMVAELLSQSIEAGWQRIDAPPQPLMGRAEQLVRESHRRVILAMSQESGGMIWLMHMRVEKT